VLWKYCLGVLMKNITHKRLVELLFYDSESGIFTRKIATGNGGRWKVGSVSGSIHSKKQGYVEISVDGDIYYAHRLAWFYVYGEWPENDIDHKDHNTTNNSIYNLRDVTRSENMQNRIKAQKNNKTGMLGAHQRVDRKGIRSRISIGGKQVNLGVFETAELAHQAYIEAKRMHHATCQL